MRRTSGKTYVTPILSDGTVQKQDATADTSGADGTGRGWFNLAAGTYYFPLPAIDATFLSVHMQHDATIAITSAVVETCDLDEDEVGNYSDNAGEWFAENSSSAYVPVDGATTTATNGTVAVVAGNKGGARWNLADLAARRAHLKVVVGTQGKLRVAYWAKD